MEVAYAETGKELLSKRQWPVIGPERHQCVLFGGFADGFSASNSTRGSVIPRASNQSNHGFVFTIRASPVQLVNEMMFPDIISIAPVCFPCRKNLTIVLGEQAHSGDGTMRFIDALSVLRSSCDSD